ncbi:MAG: sigma-70 family RNA polymerase sigma factor [Acidimicrobiia bacterium]|nr:sigma-70 family RNA polymerase sigma factor [Acidimicrobiia bacterium]
MIHRRDGLAALFDAESPGVFGFLLLRCGSRALAEDLMAETFAQASGLFSKGRGHEVTASWLRTVARRRLIDHWRRQGTAREGLAKLAQATKPSPAPDTDPDGRVEMALNAMSDRQRAVLVLRYLDGFSTSEVAEAIGSSYKATESLLGRARAAFRASYEGATDG